MVPLSVSGRPRFPTDVSDIGFTLDCRVRAVDRTFTGIGEASLFDWRLRS